jgi:hypothetical protein
MKAMKARRLEFSAMALELKTLHIILFLYLQSEFHLFGRVTLERKTAYVYFPCPSRYYVSFQT